MQGIMLQTTSAPLLTLDDVKDFYESQIAQSDWDHAAILVDKDHTVILLRSLQEQIVQALRISLETKAETIEALKLLNKRPASKNIVCSVVERGISDISDLKELAKLNAEVVYTAKTPTNAYQFYDYKKVPGEDNRGKNITADVARQVVFEAHGCCMYEGCGKYLLSDQLTGVKGNFHYLAHIVASSPDGPRGCEGYSHVLSDIPSNIMLLCDTHHRLIDKVAVGEHPRERLVQMRQDHMDKVTRLLEGLTFQGVPIFTAFFSVGSWIPDPPTPQEVGKTLFPFHSHPNGITYPPLLNRTYPKPLTDSDWFKIVPNDLNTARSIYSGCRQQADARTGLYAMAPGAILIGLGTILGNKNSLHPIPRSREHDSWCWVREEPLTDPFFLEGIDSLSGDESEVAIACTLTDDPRHLREVTELLVSKGVKTIFIRAKQQGNDCLGHPNEGQILRELLHQTLHALRNNNQTSLVHVLPCASNAALVELGRAIEHFHPKIRLYEHVFVKNLKYMVPRLELVPGDEQVQVQGTPLELVEEFHQHFTEASDEEGTT